MRTILPITLCILYMVAFACGLPVEAGFVLIQYSCYIKQLLNLQLSNYHPWSCIIYTGHRYRTNQVVSTKFTIVIDFLSLYCVISNHPVMVSIIVTVFKRLEALSLFYVFYGGLLDISIVFPRYLFC